ncbi:cathepsin L-like proteinase [Euwallacea similis]|uniref:cathepsin L-like proteinase n=1 Tax=Euwallacea similis TaxID=1736056 RepID=UPI00344CD219
MQSVLFCIVLLIAEICVGTAITSFKSFQLQYNKVYQSDAELSLREQTFNSNVRKIDEHNQLYAQGLTTYTMDINQFADMTPEEFSSMLKTIPLSNVSLNQDANGGNMKLDDSKLPESIDWRDLGMVTAVKNQGNCGDCWAFSTTGTLEAQLAMKENTLVALSEQNLLDCDTKKNQGCNGGAVQYAYEYIIQNGLTYEEDYPYRGVQSSTCQKGNRKAVTLKSYQNIEQYNETDLKVAVGIVGPVSVAINANPLQFYKSGVFNEVCSNEINHAVLAVGYNTTDEGQSYWIIKNSWGINWGEDGYFRLARGSGLCGVARQACYPIGINSGSSKIHVFNISAASLISGIIYMILNR